MSCYKRNNHYTYIYLYPTVITLVNSINLNVKCKYLLSLTQKALCSTLLQHRGKIEYLLLITI